MKQQWIIYQEKFSVLSSREQYLILLTGFFAVVFGCYTFIIEQSFMVIEQAEKQQKQNIASNRIIKNGIDALRNKLKQDPNAAIKQQNELYKKRLVKVDEELKQLTSELIDPVQMRVALMQLLEVNKGISLLSFQLLGVQALNLNKSAAGKGDGKAKSGDGKLIDNEAENLTLYRHGVKIKLKGSYFQLRDYLVQLERLKWKFFWREFNYEQLQYPASELEIEMYSLSTHKEFIGV
jgi:MSHA biogenesis protein MshJ